MAGFDSFEADAEAEPPHRQPRQPIQRVAATEWESVIGANGARQAEFLEDALKNGKDLRGFGRGQRFTANQIPAGEIGDGERKAIAPIAELKFTLEVRTPQRVGLQRTRERRTRRVMASPAPPLHQAAAIQHRVDRADRGTA